MTREEFCTQSTFNMIKYVYSVYTAMNEKYKDYIQNEKSYKFQFFDPVGHNIIMKPNYFAVYENSDPDIVFPIFEISKLKDDDLIWLDLSLDNSIFSWYSGDYFRDMCLVIGDNTKDLDKSYVILSPYSNAEEIFETYTEEYFFQQMTVQNIIEYEQFQKEVHWYYNNFLDTKLKADENIVIDLEKFDLKSLEGFRLI